MQPYLLAPPQGQEQADEWMRMGLEAQTKGNLPQAQVYYGHALRLNPRHALVTQNLAILFAQSNLINEALLTIERAAMMDGVFGIIQANWSLMALEAEHIDVALRAAYKALELAENAETRMSVALLMAVAGTPEKAIDLYNKVLDDKPDHPTAGPNACFVQTLTNATPKDLLKQRTRWYQTHRYKGEKKPHTNSKDLTRPLKVGYVGGDFKTHSAAMIFSNVLLSHTKAVTPICYSTLPINIDADPMTKLFHEATTLKDVNALDDDKLEAMVRADQIDILVDLAGHTNGGRLTLFTRKPAPIQVTAWGFAHGTGCPEIDYFFADPIAVKAEEREHYAEQIVDLPSIVTYRPPAGILNGVSSLPYYRHDYITFGSYARYEKLSDACLTTFARILKAVPDSRLELKDHGFRRPYSIKRVMSFMDGIAPERLLFSIATTHQEHLLTYQQADLMLDPFPHGGGVVSLEQLYMGVPMITRYGTQPAGRTGASVLTVLGKQDWIAKDEDEYVEKAVAMVQDLPKLAAMRKTLRQEFLDSPVVKGYAEQVEAAYRTMWERWCQKSSS